MPEQESINSIKFYMTIEVKEENGKLKRSIKSAEIKDGQELEKLFDEVVKLLQQEEAYKLLINAMRERFNTPTEVLEPLIKGAFTLKYTEIQLPWYLNYLIHEIIDYLSTDSTRSESNSSGILATQNLRSSLKACREFIFGSAYLYSKDQGCLIDEPENIKWITRPVFEYIKLGKSSTLTEEEQMGLVGQVLYFLGIPIISLLKKNNIQKELNELISWWQVDLEVKKFSSNSNEFNLSLEGKVTYFDAKLNPRKKLIDFPQPRQPTLVSSLHVRKTLHELSHIWINDLAKNAIICASAGSGKEVMSDILCSIVRGGGMYKVTVSTAGRKPDNLEKEIENQLRTAIGSGAVKMEKQTLNGSVFFFFDEIHQSYEEVRAWLLRMIENDEVVYEEKKLKLKGNVFYFFASSVEPAVLREMEPSDFWTRIEYFVRMDHPLDGSLYPEDQQGQFREVLRDYFCLFWIRMKKDVQVKKWLKSKLDNLTNLLAIEELSTEFEKTLSSPLIPVISVRNVRSIVKRLWGRTVNHFIVNPSTGVSDIRENFQQWIEESYKEIAKPL